MVPPVVPGQPQLQGQRKVIPIVAVRGQVRLGVLSVNLNWEHKDKSFLLFRRQDKSLPVNFMVNLNLKRKNRLLLLYLRLDNFVQVSLRVNLSPKRKDKSLI